MNEHHCTEKWIARDCLSAECAPLFVAERGNLSMVARELVVGQSTVTRHLNELIQDRDGASIVLEAIL